MAKENQELNKKAVECMFEFIELSKLLFGMGENSPYDINELKPDNKFYKPAKELAEELEIDWDKMTHEESNRIMLSLLDDYFNRINVDGDYKYSLSIEAIKKK